MEGALGILFVVIEQGKQEREEGAGARERGAPELRLDSAER